MQITSFHNAVLGESYYGFQHKSGLQVYVYPKEMSTSYAATLLRQVRLDGIKKVEESGGARLFRMKDGRLKANPRSTT